MKFTINDFRKRFPDNDSCLQELMNLHYGTHYTCPTCQKASKFHRVRGRRCFECRWCGYQIYPTQGTVLEKTTTPLSDWFYTIYLMTVTRSGVSAKEVERQLGVTYKTAWRMCHQVRKLMSDKSSDMLKGHVEIDETYIGGKRPGKRGRGAGGKSIVFGMVERGGRIKAMPVDDVKRETLIPRINAAIEKGSRISTDEMHTYKILKHYGYEHASVQHAAKQYVAGDVHVQNTEGFWARLKLSIKGTHVWVSRKHLSKYVDEFSFRYSNRKNPEAMFDVALSGLRSSSKER